jgi:hypothetical protein
MDSASNEDTQLSKFIDKFIKHLDENIYDIFPKEKDLKVAGAILELFRHRASLDILSKKSNNNKSIFSYSNYLFQHFL